MFTGSIIAEAIQNTGLRQLRDEAAEKLAIYGNLLVKWNSRMNLTAIHDPSAILDRHIVESVAAAQFLPEGLRTLLDFGSGAGLPGVPIAVCRTEIAVTLAESQSKKAAFLSEVARTLHVGLVVHGGRVATLAPGKQYGAVTLRAVDQMEEAVKEAKGRVAPGGHLLLFATEGTRGKLVEAVGTVPVRESSDIPSGSMLLFRRDVG